ncbi:MAG: tyrosinase family protein [Polyangiales bacterium]
MTDNAIVTDQLRGFLLEDVPTRGDGFSDFDPEHLELLSGLFRRLVRVADEGGAGDLDKLDAVLTVITQLKSVVDHHALQEGLLRFAAHHPVGRLIRVPRFAVRRASRVFKGGTPLLSTGVEQPLDWFREDLLYNEHHAHWHIIYRAGDLADRQGELFVSMHRQMLARYEAERVSLGLPPVVALFPYTTAIEAGHDPAIAGVGSRQPGRALSAGVAAALVAQSAWVPQALAQRTVPTAGGSVMLPAAPTDAQQIAAVDAFGAQLELAPHNGGHGRLAQLSTPQSGPMSSTDTAVRDPVFYQWHRHIDDLAVAFENLMPPRDFASFDPGVEVSPVIVTPATNWDPQVDRHAWATQTFGGANWDQDFGTAAPGTESFRTQFHIRDVPEAPLGLRFPIEDSFGHLDHEDFAWVVRVRNSGSTPKRVTVRIFLAPVTLADDRRMWIEMDRFAIDLLADERKAVFRQARESAVIRKRKGPADLIPDPFSEEDDTAEADLYCECGWPRHLLIPSGAPDGLDVLVAVFVSGDDSVVPGAGRVCLAPIMPALADVDARARAPSRRPSDRRERVHEAG